MKKILSMLLISIMLLSTTLIVSASEIPEDERISTFGMVRSNATINANNVLFRDINYSTDLGHLHKGTKIAHWDCNYHIEGEIKYCLIEYNGKMGMVAQKYINGHS